MTILAMDMGGTFIKWSLVQRNKKNIKFLKSNKFLTLNENESADGRNIIKKIGIFAQQMKQEYQEIKCVCTTVVGIVNPYTSVILSPNHTLKNYEGMNIKKEFKKYCSLPLYVINDVKAAATGELYYGSLKDKKNVNAVVLTIGTGFAGCPIINGEIYLGSTFASGEGGQMVINGHYFENHYMVPSLIKRCKAIDNSIINAEQCLELVKTNKDIKTEVDAWFIGLFEGIMNYVFLFNPSYIVFGGGITEHRYFDLDIIKKLLIKFARKPVSAFEHVKLLKAKLGNKAAIYGAASLAR